MRMGSGASGQGLRLTGRLAGVGMVAAMLSAWPSQSAVAAQPIDPAVLGASADNAAGSCWEIKQVRPTAASGAYWVLTPQMSEPREVYCDQESDGGGWVLVGKGREGWTREYEGRGQPSELLTPDMAMGSQAYQYHSRVVNGLLGGGEVSALSDGVRIRRATNTSGTQWQEVRVRFAKMKGWAWTLGSEHPLTSWSFDGARGSGGDWRSFGSGQLLNRMVTTTGSGKRWRIGYGYGSSVTGQNNDTSYLWASTDGGGAALPYAQVYLRPQITSSEDGFTPIPDSGTEPIARPLVTRSTAMVTPWGVSGLAGSTGREGNVEVQAFTQSGDTMYVGGNFRYVQQDASGTGRVTQSFLAAFDVDTGQWVSSFRPTLDEQVRALETLPDGSIVAAGDFSQANGQPATAIVALDPVTGATRPDWNLTLENGISGGVLSIRTLDVSGDYLYVGGAVTHFRGGSAPNTSRYMRGLGRVSVVDGTPSADWNPEFNGTVVSTDGAEDRSRVYAAGYFDASRGDPAPNAAVLLAGAGAELVPWLPTWSAAGSYQQAIREVGDRLWVGGSEHSTFTYDLASLTRLSGEISKNSGGDVQAIDADRGVVYVGSHAGDMEYTNAFTWPNVGTGWTDVNHVKWVAAYDAETGQRIPDFVPNLGLRNGSGVWAIQADSNGNVWMGGDLESAQTDQGGRFSGGFARFPTVDATPPPTPSNFRMTSQSATTVSLAWSTVSDAGGGVRYQILLDDRPIAATPNNHGSITVPKGGAGRYFVRAVDAAGNVGASTRVLVVGSGDIAPSASFEWSAERSTLSVDASASSGVADLVAYDWDFGDGSVGTGLSATHSYAAAGDYLATLTVTDANGMTDTTSQVVSVAAPPRPRPTDLYGAEVYDQEPWAYYRLDEDTGSIASDVGPDRHDGAYAGNVARSVPGALANSDDRAVALDGANSGFIVSPAESAPPTEFTVGIWFRTTSSAGGRLIGYAATDTGLSNHYDRHLFLQNDGRVVLGAWSGSENRVTSPGSYRDGAWHYAVGTMSPADGMRLYVDGQQVGSNPNTTAESFLGYWKIGTDRLWSGASSMTLDGQLDEAVVYHRALTAAQVAEQWRLGSTHVEPPPNEPPTASFSVTVDDLHGTFDANESVDAEGPIQTYDWSFGDGETGTGVVANHTYAADGTYTVTLTVTDSAGATASATRDVTVVAPPVEEVVVANGASWRWRYASDAPPSSWKDVDFDAASWSEGNAVLGFGADDVTTNIDGFASSQDRAKTAYFRRGFQVSDASRVTQLELRSVADDGVVIYVNGTEVTRSNMPTGTITHQTFASSARREAEASADPVVVDVPIGLLRDGTNIIAAETHLNYRSTPDVTFELKATLTSQPAVGPPAAPVAAFSADVDGMSVSVDAGGSHDPDGTITGYAWDFGDGSSETGRLVSHAYATPGSYQVRLTVTDDSGRTATDTKDVTIQAQPIEQVVVAKGADWRWRYESTAPPATWSTPTFDASGWNVGPAPLGWGAPTVVTDIDGFATTQDRARAAYFTRSFTIDDLGSVSRLRLESIGDDGAVVYVNGTEVARSNMPTGDITNLTFASSARRYDDAAADPILVDVPLGLLVNGTNVLAVETHLNYRATPDVSFDLKATLTQE